MGSLWPLIGAVCLFLWPEAPLSAAKLGETCDGIAALRCDEGLWCEHPGGQCTVADGSGMCAKTHGKTYGNDCARKAAKAQLDHIGECAK